MAAKVTCEVRIQEADFDLAETYRQLRDPGLGACVLFVGLVRDFNDLGEVRGLELEHYPGMTESAISAMADEAGQRWPIERVQVVHRVGQLGPGDQIVLVAVAGTHRHAAFAACEFIMDYLKTAAPIWKKELGPDGGRWVDAKDSDRDARDRWISSESTPSEDEILQ